MASLYLLEPDAPGARWAPFAGAAPLHTLRAGAWTLGERWERALGAKATGALAAHAGPTFAGAVPLVEPGAVTGPAWVVDATFAPKLPMRAVGSAKRLVHEGKPVAWRLDAGQSWSGPFTSGDGIVVDGRWLQGAADLLTVLEQSLFADTLLGLEDGGGEPIPDGVLVFGNPAAIALRGAELEPGVILDARKGAIILERGVQVRSGTRIEGPTWVREGTWLLGGQMRHLSAGPHCRLHGEISTSAFMGYANKSHDGFLGHSLVGQWVNLGAGTITSNLKNTYGEVTLDVGGEKIATGRTNVGALIGDHVKTAIGTLLPTGTVLGAGAQLFLEARAPKYLPPFAWGEAGVACKEDAFLTTAQRVLPRRDVKVDAKADASLRALYRRLAPR